MTKHESTFRALRKSDIATDVIYVSLLRPQTQTTQASNSAHLL